MFSVICLDLCNIYGKFMLSLTASRILTWCLNIKLCADRLAGNPINSRYLRSSQGLGSKVDIIAKKYFIKPNTVGVTRG